MSTYQPDEVRAYKHECLMDEHQSLSSFVEKEVVMTAVIRAVCAASWVIGLGLLVQAKAGSTTILVSLLGAILSFWIVDLFYAYTGVVYKMRRKQIREWLHELPAASDDVVASWYSPANPFDTLGRSDKMQALKDTVTSPPVLAPYAVLEVATILISCCL